jgi:hypothetical protein
MAQTHSFPFRKILNLSVILTSLLAICYLAQPPAGVLTQAYAAAPVFSTSFEDSVKTDANHLNLPVPHWFEFGDSDGGTNGDGAKMWVDTTLAHTGSKSIGLEVFDINKSRRAEFDLMDMQKLTGDEGTISVWLYLPSDYGLHAPGIDWNWHEFFVLYSERSTGYPYDNYLRLTIDQPVITTPSFNLSLGGRRPPNGTSYTYGTIKPFPLPRGRWFNVHSYLKRDPVAGAAKIWVDNQLAFDKTGINTKDYSIWKTTIAKLYYETTDTTDHKIWVDDLNIFPGFVAPGTNPTSTPNPTPVLKSGDANYDNRIDGVDYVIWLIHYGQILTGGNVVGDFNNDGRVDGIDYVIWLNNYGR